MSTRRRLTLSRAALAAICDHWLQPSIELPADDTSAEAGLGLEVHAAAAAVIEGLEGPALSERAAKYHSAWLAQWWRPRAGQGWRAEIAYALHPASGEAIEIKLEAPRAYPDLGPGWLFGTADAVLVTDDRVVVVDWKTGRHVPAAAGNTQLAGLGLAASIVNRRRQADVAIVGVAPGGITTDPHPLDSIDLEGWREHLTELVTRSPLIDPNPGPHCSALFCPARRVCAGPNTPSAVNYWF